MTKTTLIGQLKNPALYEEGMNLYRYVRNAPTYYFDPYGSEAIHIVADQAAPPPWETVLPHGGGRIVEDRVRPVNYILHGLVFWNRRAIDIQEARHGQRATTEHGGSGSWQSTCGQAAA